MPSSELHRQIARLTSELAGRELNPELQDWLNREHGAGSNTFREIEQTCQLGLAEGWLCQHEAGGIRYGRVFKPAAELQGFSVDVVDMDDDFPEDANVQFVPSDDGHPWILAIVWAVIAFATPVGGVAIYLTLGPAVGRFMVNLIGQ